MLKEHFFKLKIGLLSSYCKNYRMSVAVGATFQTISSVETIFLFRFET